MPGTTVLTLCVLILPDAAVLQPVANMYSAPTEESAVVSQAIYGSNVELLEQKDRWGRIRTADDYAGWMPLSALRLERTYAVQGRVAEVQCLFAHLYREADVTKHAPLHTVPFETKLEVISDDRDNSRWLQVRLPDDRTAWIQSGAVAFAVKPLSVPAMIDLSKRKLDKSGGMLEAYNMIRIAKSLGMKTMLGCMVSSSVSVTAASHLAPLVDYADLDGNLLIDNDPFQGVIVEKGRLLLPKGPGLGLKENE